MWGSSGALGRVVLVAVAASLLLAGCDPVRAPAPTPTPSSTPPPPSIAPLTGEVVEEALTNPSLSAKVDNHPDARPQFGLERTDIVFEELVEGGLSRYVAIWHSDVPDEIGPVRSIRPMDPDIISPFGGIVAYSGGQPVFIEAMRTTGLYNAIHGQADTAGTFYRTDLRKAPHNVLVRAPQLVAQHLDLVAPAQQFDYSLDAASSTAALEGDAIASMNLVIGAAATPSWAWDPAELAYNRFMTGGAADTDVAGAQLTAVNVIVLRVDVTYGFGIPKTELIGGGEAWVSTGGGTVHASWSKGAAADPIRIVDDNGEPVSLAPGNTWIELVPLSGSADFVAPV